MKEFYLKNKKILDIFFIAIFSIAFLGIARACWADPLDSTITWVLGGIAQMVVSVCGYILTSVINAIIKIASYNDFINNNEIREAWIIVRDLCNMFFILILLIIAFATILRVETYQWKKALPKLLIMAVLINFSRTICGLFIDFSQVIMLTFVNAFSDSGGNFVSLLQVQKYLDIVGSTEGKWFKDDSIDFRNTVAGILIAVIFMIIATITLIAILIIFIMRVIMLWIYVVLSPLAFLLSAFPAGAKYASQYWGDFTKYLINGPVLAFFIWLALATMNKLDVNQFIGAFQGGKVEMLKPENFMSFILAIGFLVGGLIVSQQIGGIGASWGAGAVRGLGTRGLGFAKGMARKGALLPLKGTGMLASYGARKFSKHYFEIRPTKIIGGIKEAFGRSKVKDEGAIQQRGGELLGKGGLRGVLGGWGAGAGAAEQYLTGFMNIKGFKNMARNIRWGSGARKKLQDNYNNIKDKELKPKEEALAKLESNYESPENRERTVSKLKKVDEQINEFSKRAETETDKEKAVELATKVENLLGEKEKLEVNFKKRIETKDIREQKEKIKKEIEDIMKNKIKPAEEAISHAMPPRAFEARAARSALIGEEKAKIKDVKNDKELIQLYRDAEAKKDKYRMTAIAERLFEDGNGNELLNDYGYASTAVGLHQFTKDQFVKTKLMNKNESLQTQADFSEIAQRVNHWEMAKTVGVNESGELKSLIEEKKDGQGNIIGYDDSEHAHAAAAEIFKIDPQRIMRDLNRLALGGEMPDKKGGREFYLSTLGKILTKTLTSQFKDHGKRMQSNTAYNLSKPHIVAKMRAINVPEETITIIKGKGEQEGEPIDPGKAKDKLVDMGEHITPVDKEGNPIYG